MGCPRQRLELSGMGWVWTDKKKESDVRVLKNGWRRFEGISDEDKKKNKTFNSMVSGWLYPNRKFED